MKPLDGHFGLIRPDAAKLSLATNQDRTGIRIDEELWKLGLGKPGAIVFDQLDHIGGVTPARDNPPPRPLRPSALRSAWKRPCGERQPLSRHLSPGPAPRPASTQHALLLHL